MLLLGQEQHLGHKAFVLLFIRNTFPSLAILFLALIASNISGFMEQSILEALNASLQLNSSSPSLASTIVSNIVFGLYTLALFLFVVGYFIAELTYKFYTFTLEEFDLRLKRGIFNLETVSIPYRQIQDVNINRSLFYRIIGVSKVIIDSAGHEETGEFNETDILLEPIDREVAEEIRIILQRKIGVQVIEHEKEADKDMKQKSTYPQL
ncbi:MAG: PH domain-containing protein [Candidatus Paceibacterota bacterium]|jgi:uncharacterized membrane protein YdbT with pleckstrin-like domain